MKQTKKENIKFVRKAKRKKKTLNVISIVIIFCMSYAVLFNTYKLLTGKNYISIGNISYICALDDMMKPEIKKNALVILRKANEIKTGENIAYIKNDEVLLAKVVNVKENENITTYITKANQGYYLNNYEIEKQDVIGKVVLDINFLGKIINILQSTITLVILIFVLCMMFIYNKYMQGKNIERKRKLEQKPKL